MCLTAVLPHFHGLTLDRVDYFPGQTTLVLRARSRRAACPICGRLSRGVHSRYWRALADVPIGGVAVILRLQAQHFYCRTRTCPRQVFCERFPQLTRPMVGGPNPCAPR